MTSWIYYLDLIGTLVFAISGVLLAFEKDFDLVGSIILGIVTGVGGGTLRDILIGETPTVWMKDLNYLFAVLIAVALSYIFRNIILRLHRSMLFFDALGLGVFTIIGLEKTLGVGLSIPIALMMGVVTAVFGGVIRDVLANEVPLIFRKKIYATACFAGGVMFLLTQMISPYINLNMLVSIFTVVVIRYLSIKYDWSLQL